MKLHYFQHVDFETPAMIHHWADERDYSESITRFYEDDATLPNISDYDALIIMGGPMGVNDEVQYPWLAAEKEHIKDAIDAGKAVLGICLGAQLIADVLGAKVTPNTHKEIGYFPITLTPHAITEGLDKTTTVFHWHGDTFGIPDGANHLASSEACENQAFIYHDNVLALQFHMEMNTQSIQTLIKHAANDITDDSYVQSADEMLAQALMHDTYDALTTLLDNWINSQF